MRGKGEKGRGQEGEGGKWRKRERGRGRESKRREWVGVERGTGRERKRKPQSVMVCFKSPSVKYSIILGQLTFEKFLFNSDLYSNQVITEVFRGYMTHTMCIKLPQHN